MFFCYIDEAGCPGVLPNPTANIQPVLVLCGLVVPESSVHQLTNDFLDLKRKFNPRLASKLNHDLDIVKYEVKGAEDLRKPIRRNDRNKKRRAIGFIDKTIALLEVLDCKIIPKIYIKSPGRKFDGGALYSCYMQDIHKHFQHFLESKNEHGFVIADSRSHGLNVGVSHSIFTQKFKYGGDAYANILEMPVYGHSDNHVALQITDILCSALLFPITTYAYCSDHIDNVHVNSAYKQLQDRYSMKLKSMTYRYIDGERHRGGVTVHDAILQRNANLFFQPN